MHFKLVAKKKFCSEQVNIFRTICFSFMIDVVAILFFRVLDVRHNNVTIQSNELSGHNLSYHIIDNTFLVDAHTRCHFGLSFVNTDDSRAITCSNGSSDALKFVFTSEFLRTIFLIK